ncbi:MAG: heterocyst frequency control protein PatD [Cyanobacteria bacterium P01_A01_bin.135]
MADSSTPSSLPALLAALQVSLAEWQQTQDGALIGHLASLQRQMQQVLPTQVVPADRQPYLTEFHRQLRLLGTDIGFLKAARKPETQKLRLATLGERLQMLQGYCDAMTNGGIDAPTNGTQADSD